MIIMLDGREALAGDGETLLDVSKRQGISVPTLCHHPALPPEASCRLCVVEDAKTHKLVPACATPAVEGQVIETDSPRVREARRFGLQVILARHPLDCAACDRAGACELQDLILSIPVEQGPFEATPRAGAPDLSHPFVGFDPQACVLCHRCVRGCAEIQGRNAIGVFARGADTFIATGLQQRWADSICESCGTCIALCPTGALFDRPAQLRGPAVNFQKVTTTCPYCGVGCTLDLNVKDGQVHRVTPNWTTGVNAGALCVKGRFGHEFIHDPKRLTRPLLRDRSTGEFRAIGWDEALDWFAARLLELREREGPDAFGLIASAKATNEENYLFQKFARAVIGTNNIDHCARL